jgi:hypothetical protein
MIAFAFKWYVVICSWFGCNAMIVTHLIFRWNGVILQIFTLSDTIPFLIRIVPFLYTFITGYGPV